MIENYTIRPALLTDIDFIIETIIAAEKGGTDKLSYATLFKLTEEEFKKYIKCILEEDINGCEFSISSFLVIDVLGKPIAAVGGWLEGINEDNLPSAILKSNLVSYHFPKENLLSANTKSNVIKGTQIKRENNTYQIEYVYVDDRYRGQNFAGILIDAHIKRCKKLGCKIMQVQLSANNKPALTCYQKAGFYTEQIYTSENMEILNYLPFNQKLLMQKIIC
jgi:ribosomal protein S18 acetylase RimI-like enzyme